MLRRLREHLRRRRIAREFKRLMGGYDQAIERARSRHLPVRALVQAKRDFLHSLLAPGVRNPLAYSLSETEQDGFCSHG